jgi:signal transduction histidine kinase/ActR/RegA family two-component response regulator
MLMQDAPASASAAELLAAMRNVTLVERPAPIRSVLSALQSAVRARQRQYQIRDQLNTIRAAQDERQMLLDSERAARQEAERANRLKDEFLATLSHELRTPLNAIFGWTRIMALRAGDTTTIVEGINVIERNVRVQMQLIEDLFDMSRIISGKIRLEMVHIRISEVIDAAVESVMPAMVTKNIHLTRIIDPDVDYVWGDPGRLQQVFWNLLTNAVKFTPKDGRIDVFNVRVHCRFEITIRDSGEGIPPEFLPRLFERFTQADGSPTRMHGGLGLGLSIVRNLVEMHEGTVHASSAGKNQGATFTVVLPVPAHQTAGKVNLRGSQTNPEGTRHLRQLKGVKVLLVDDEPDARDLVSRLLMDCEATLTLAESAIAANSILASFTPDVIVSDIGMPIQDGYDFMRVLRRQGLKIPAIALTAFASPEDRIRSIQAGYQMHLTKPFEPAELIAVIANLAGRYESPEQ